MKKYLLVLALGVVLTAAFGMSYLDHYKAPINFDSGQPNGLLGKPEVHPCNGIEHQARRIHEAVQLHVKTEDDLLGLLNTLQDGVKENPEFVILQQAAQFMFDEGDVVPEVEKFWTAQGSEVGIKAAKDSLVASKMLADTAAAASPEELLGKVKVLGGSCRSCHTQHREKNAEGKYIFKY